MPIFLSSFQALVCFPVSANPTKSSSTASISEDVEKIKIEDPSSPGLPSPDELRADKSVEARLRTLLTILKPDSVDEVDFSSLRRNVKDCCVEFLRPLAIFYSALTLVPPPDALKYSMMEDFEPLCRYLGMPVGLLALLEGAHVERLFTE